MGEEDVAAGDWAIAGYAPASFVLGEFRGEEAIT
jgi:hypothetical protein